MDITELMIGDTLAYLDNEQLVIVDIKKIDGLCGVVCVRQDNGHVFNTTIDNLYPIPITENILKQNFPDAKDLDDLIWWPLMDKPGKFCVSLSRSDPDDMNKYIHKYSGICDYVHQLQNILRHCGKSDKISLPVVKPKEYD